LSVKIDSMGLVFAEEHIVTNPAIADVSRNEMMIIRATDTACVFL